jgi:hypothetical protein
MITFMETGSTTTPSRGRGKGTSKKNERYHSDVEDEEQVIAQVCFNDFLTFPNFKFKLESVQQFLNEARD